MAEQTECASCEEMLDEDEVTYCPGCDAPICNECLALYADTGKCHCCPDE
jgi:hypothetical protein